MSTFKIQEANSGEVDKERTAHAMADPEIQQILNDPTIRQVLTDFQENPKYAQQAMADPHIRAKIEKLVSAGVLQVK
jgi:stress-induced-phosphoprotein 1